MIDPETNSDDIGQGNIHDISSNINGDVIFGRNHVHELNGNSYRGTDEDDSNCTQGKYDCFDKVLQIFFQTIIPASERWFF